MSVTRGLYREQRDFKRCESSHFKTGPSVGRVGAEIWYEILFNLSFCFLIMQLDLTWLWQRNNFKNKTTWRSFSKRLRRFFHCGWSQNKWRVGPSEPSVIWNYPAIWQMFAAFLALTLIWNCLCGSGKGIVRTT